LTGGDHVRYAFAPSAMMIPILTCAAAFMLLEWLRPDQKLPHVPRWWPRVILVNACQAGMVVLAGYTWDHWLQRASLFRLSESGLGPFVQGLIGYVCATFVYYWWHRTRHEVNFFWLALHQFHHSPSRIQTITSFYKHPLEMFANSLVSGATSYTLLGCSIEGAAWVSFWSAITEFIYHMNFATPRWLGWFVQRPEMHRIHHQRGLHFYNFADLPIWDMLFGTYRNPPAQQGLCGYKLDRELNLKDMLLCRNVNGPYRGPQKEAVIVRWFRGLFARAGSATGNRGAP
jgi:sterol desaturase/sphingolipid hydroxylase (fatty acid hydroxylase superfamily)